MQNNEQLVCELKTSSFQPKFFLPYFDYQVRYPFSCRTDAKSLPSKIYITKSYLKLFLYNIFTSYDIRANNLKFNSVRLFGLIARSKHEKNLIELVQPSLRQISFILRP